MEVRSVLKLAAYGEGDFLFPSVPYVLGVNPDGDVFEIDIADFSNGPEVITKEDLANKQAQGTVDTKLYEIAVDPHGTLQAQVVVIQGIASAGVESTGWVRTGHDVTSYWPCTYNLATGEIIRVHQPLAQNTVSAYDSVITFPYDKNVTQTTVHNSTLTLDAISSIKNSKFLDSTYDVSMAFSDNVVMENSTAIIEGSFSIVHNVLLSESTTANIKSTTLSLRDIDIRGTTLTCDNNELIIKQLTAKEAELLFSDNSAIELEAVDVYGSVLRFEGASQGVIYHSKFETSSQLNVAEQSTNFSIRNCECHASYINLNRLNTPNAVIHNTRLEGGSTLNFFDNSPDSTVKQLVAQAQSTVTFQEASNCRIWSSSATSFGVLRFQETQNTDIHSCSVASYGIIAVLDPSATVTHARVARCSAIANSQWLIRLGDKAYLNYSSVSAGAQHYVRLNANVVVNGLESHGNGLGTTHFTTNTSIPLTSNF